ncbi:hypothetical protein [Streptomyces sp. NBC_00572]|uniref:hypothetical protein n=1 Tax=Streptomyces sp. NBC_00572 TaxID=2903664 RepID=UPI00224F68D5|nr:hypothetical protein [Streptomyces sp. NBC_00572]MCX4981547.1 hypothetical protein [Streptomyces sp. NBC_00572]
MRAFKSGTTSTGLRRKVASIAAAFAMAGTGLAASASPAAAGSLGQQLAVGTTYSDMIYVCGFNQNGENVCTPWTDSPETWTYFSGWWFHGRVKITGYRNDAPAGESPWRTATCDVPETQTSNWFPCYTSSQL